MKKLKNSFLQNKNIDTINKPKLKKSHLGWVIIGVLSVQTFAGPVTAVSASVFDKELPEPNLIYNSDLPTPKLDGTISNPISSDVSDDEENDEWKEYEPKAKTDMKLPVLRGAEHEADPQGLEIDMWKASADADTNANTGTYGEAGYENSVFADNPFKDKIIDSDITDPSKLETVKAKGITGTLKWYISEDNVLHLGSGTPVAAQYYSPWEILPQDIARDISRISVDGDVVLPKNSSNMFRASVALLNVSGIDNLNKIDTSNVENMSNMFRNLRIVSLEIDSFNTSKVKNMTGMFQSSSFNKIVLKNFDTSSVETMKDMFKGMKQLTEIDGLGNFIVSRVKDMTSMFELNEKMTSYNISNWHTANLEKTTKMFSENDSLKEISFSGWSFSKVINSDSMFYNDVVLNKITFNSIPTSNLKSMNKMFYNTNVSELDLSSFDTRNVTDMEDAFSKIGLLRKVIIGDDFKILNPSNKVGLPNQRGNKKWREIGAGTFRNPLGAYIDEAVDLQSNNMVVSITNDNFKKGTYALTNSTVSLWQNNNGNRPSENIGVYGESGYENYVLKSDPWLDIASIDDVVVASKVIKVKAKGIWGSNVDTGVKWYITEDGVLHLGSGKGYNTRPISSTYWNDSPWDLFRDDIKKIIFDGQVKLTNNSSFLFSKMSNLEEIVNIDNMDTSSVTNMRGFFAGLTNLKKLDLSNFDTSNVTTFESMFNNIGLEELDLSHLNTSKVTNMSKIFMGSNLKKIDISMWDTSKVTDMSEMFHYARNLIDLNIRNINTSNVTSIASMFRYAINLESLDLTDLDISKVNASINVFQVMPKLRKIIFGSNFVLNDQYNNSTYSKIYLDQKKDYKWREMGTSSNPSEPNGLFIDEKDDKQVIIRNESITVPGTYVLAPYAPKVYLWSKHSDSDTTKNFGTYGDPGLENYISDYNPWFNEVLEEYVGTSKLIKVKAKGIWGPDVETGVKWYISENGVLHLSGGFGYNTSLGEATSPWLKYQADIKKISIDGDVKLPSVSRGLFIRLENVTSISGMNRLDSSNVTNMAFMFAYMTALKNIDVSNLDTSNAINMSYIFTGDRNLKELNVSNFDTSHATDMSGMFSYTTLLEKIDGLTNFDTTNVKKMIGMFQEARGLKELDLSSFDTRNVESMKMMFEYTTSLSKLKFGENFKMNMEIGKPTLRQFKTVDGLFWREIIENSDGTVTKGDFIDLKNLDIKLSNDIINTPGTYILDHAYQTNIITVLDETNSPVSDVELELVNKTGNVVATGKTDENGKYVFKDIIIGEYTVRQKPKDGYETAESVKVNNENTDATMHVTTLLGNQLPNTGSKSAILWMASSILLFGVATAFGIKKHKEDLKE